MTNLDCLRKTDNEAKRRLRDYEGVSPEFYLRSWTHLIYVRLQRNYNKLFQEIIKLFEIT
jgi:hypothetical protein